MDRNESIELAITMLKEQGLSGYVLYKDTLSRFKEDEESQQFAKLLENL